MKNKEPRKIDITERALKLICESNASAFGGNAVDIKSYYIKKARLELNK